MRCVVRPVESLMYASTLVGSSRAISHLPFYQLSCLTSVFSYLPFSKSKDIGSLNHRSRFPLISQSIGLVHMQIICAQPILIQLHSTVFFRISTFRLRQVPDRYTQLPIAVICITFVLQYHPDEEAVRSAPCDSTPPNAAPACESRDTVHVAASTVQLLAACSILLSRTNCWLFLLATRQNIILS